jgi:hypothetical protein
MNGWWAPASWGPPELPAPPRPPSDPPFYIRNIPCRNPPYTVRHACRGLTCRIISAAARFPHPIPSPRRSTLLTFLDWDLLVHDVPVAPVRSRLTRFAFPPWPHCSPHRSWTSRRIVFRIQVCRWANSPAVLGKSHPFMCVHVLPLCVAGDGAAAPTLSRACESTAYRQTFGISLPFAWVICVIGLPSIPAARPPHLAKPVPTTRPGPSPLGRALASPVPHDPAAPHSPDALKAAHLQKGHAADEAVLLPVVGPVAVADALVVGVHLQTHVLEQRLRAAGGGAVDEGASVKQ